MIKNAGILQDFEDSQSRKAIQLSFAQALNVFEAMWNEGIALGVLPLKDPLDGIDIDIRIAEILNLCSKTSSPE